MNCKRLASFSFVMMFSILASCSSDETKRPKLLGIQIEPQSASIAVGETKKFNAIGTFDDLSHRPEMIYMVSILYGQPGRVIAPIL